MSRWSKEGAICPYCENPTRPEGDHYTLFSGETCEYECSSCGRKFVVEVFASYSWTASPITKDGEAIPAEGLNELEDCIRDRKRGKAVEHIDDGDEGPCVVCGDQFEDGDLVYWSTNDDGHMHAECATSYVDEDGKETDVPPKPMRIHVHPRLKINPEGKAQ